MAVVEQEGVLYTRSLPDQVGDEPKPRADGSTTARRQLFGGMLRLSAGLGRGDGQRAVEGIDDPGSVVAGDDSEPHAVVEGCDRSRCRLAGSVDLATSHRLR